MAYSKKNICAVLAAESFSTKAAQEVLASQTKAFGNKAAKLQLQMATAAFVQAKQNFEAAEALKTTSQEQE